MGAPSGRPDESALGEPELARFLRDWSAMWRREMHARSMDATAMDARTDGTGPGLSMPGLPLGAPPGLQDRMGPAMEAWRAAVTLWADAMLVAPSSLVAPRDSVRTARPGPEGTRVAGTREAGTAAAAAASDAVDDAVQRLARRVDELEARLARLESPLESALPPPLEAKRRRRG